MWPPLPNRCCYCGDPMISLPFCYCGDPMVSLPFCYFGGEAGGAGAVEEERATAYRPPWTSQLLAADFHETCARDRVCLTCAGAAFCAHCCGEHHRGHVTSAAADEEAAAGHRRDSFCTGCRVAFCSELCAHHQGHEIIPIDEYNVWHCARCTGYEWWFPVFHGVQTFRDEHGNLLVPLQRRRAVLPERPGPKYGVKVEGSKERPAWTSELLAADFYKTCARDRVCHTCAGAAFCAHCCGEHHRGHVTSATTGADDDDADAGHRRDSFCTACRVDFCFELCAHHEGHEVIPVDEYDGWRCLRCTGFERWFHAFQGVQTFQDEHGNLLVPLQPRPRRVVAPEAPGPKCGVKAEGIQECPAWLSELVASDFSKTCARDHVCNTCAGAAFCWHCCGEHHRGHDRVVDTDEEVDGWAASVGHRRDSFCIGCRVAFSSELCAHHEGHGVIPVDAYGDRHFMRSNGSEPWFSVLGGIETYEDEDGNLMVPLERKRSMFPEPGLKYSTRHHG